VLKGKKAVEQPIRIIGSQVKRTDRAN